MWESRVFSKINKTIKSDRGDYFIMCTLIFVVLLILTVGLVEFGRVMMFRNELQTAGDAAALAAAGNDDGVTKWVRVTVTTDRGNFQPPCDDDGCPPCSACGSTDITVVGLEEELLDKGGWQDFCIPPCDCGGDDCTIQIVDRWVTMTTSTATTGGNSQDIQNAISSIVGSTKTALTYKAYPRVQPVANVFARANSMGEIQNLLSNHNAYMRVFDDRNCAQYRPRTARDSTRPYNYCMSVGSDTWQQLQGSRDFVNRMEAAINKLNGLGSKQTTAGVTNQYVGEVVHDYLVANAPEAWASDVQVFDQRNSPYYPSVVVYAMTNVEVLMKDFVGIPLLLDPSADYLWGGDDTVATVETCSQGDVHYIDPTLTQYSEYGDLSAAPGDRYYVDRPADACWQ